MKRKWLIGALSVSTVLAGCASLIYGYAAPTPKPQIENQRIINAGYDQTWSALVDYVSSTFFSIRNFEKESGLLTLSFGEGNIPRFVDCGTWHEGSSRFPYIERDLGFSLRGQMNLRVRAVSADKTDVRISTRYLLRVNSGNVYDFTTDQQATIAVKDATSGTPPTRTCQSTHAAEEQILTGIAAISTK